MADQTLWKGTAELSIKNGQKVINAVGAEGFPSAEIDANDIFLGGKFFDGLVKKLNGK